MLVSFQSAPRRSARFRDDRCLNRSNVEVNFDIPNCKICSRGGDAGVAGGECCGASKGCVELGGAD